VPRNVEIKAWLGMAPEALVDCAYIDLLERAADRGVA